MSLIKPPHQDHNGQSEARMVWVDVVKAIAIWLIVLGHAQGLLSREFLPLLYAFHVPVFIIISGLLLPELPLAKGFIKAFSKRIAPQIRYYLFFSVISMVIYIFGRLVVSGDLEIPKLVWGVLYGTNGPDAFGYSDGMLHENRPLWYFPFLVSSMTLFLVCLSFGRKVASISIVVLMIANTMIVPLDLPRLPWAIDVAGIGAFFILIGWVSREKINTVVVSQSSLIVFSIIGFCLVWLITDLNGRMNINRNLFGDFPPLAILGACIGSASLIAVAKAVPCFGLFERLSRHTLVIFVAHKYPLMVLQKVAFVSLPKALFFPAAIVISLLTTYLCLLFSEWAFGWLSRHVGRTNKT